MDRDFLVFFMDVNAFKVHGGVVTQSAVEAFRIIESLNVIEEGQAGSLMSLELMLMERFSFESAPEGFHGGVVVAVAGGAHTGKSFERRKALAVIVAGVLDGAVGGVEQTRFGSTRADG